MDLALISLCIASVACVLGLLAVRATLSARWRTLRAEVNDLVAAYDDLVERVNKRQRKESLAGAREKLQVERVAAADISSEAEQILAAARGRAVPSPSTDPEAERRRLRALHLGTTRH